ncbi:MAG: cupredoxin domain-containing protein [Dehalococcoidia bacterium]
MNQESRTENRLARITRRLRLAAVGSLCALALFAVSCGDDDETTPTAAASPTTEATTEGTPGIHLPESVTTVTITDNKFTPLTLQVPRGTTITWNWTGKNIHSVVGEWDGKQVESSKQRTGTFQFTFDSTGTFEYQCGVHGEAMSASITVQ